MKQCKYCGEQIPNAANVCPYCCEPQENTVKICPYCAEEIDENADVCPVCGETLPLGTALSENTEQAESSTETNDDGFMSSNKNAWLIIAIALCIIAIAVGLRFFLEHKASNKDQVEREITDSCQDKDAIYAPILNYNVNASSEEDTESTTSERKENEEYMQQEEPVDYGASDEAEQQSSELLME